MKRTIKSPKKKGTVSKKQIKKAVKITSILRPLDDLIKEVEKHDTAGVKCLKEVRDEIATNIRSKLF